MPPTVPLRASPVVFFGGGGVNPVSVGTSGGGSNPAGTDSQNVLKTFSVETYGATKGTSVDSTTAFAKTMAALIAAGGGIFYIPPGTWKADPPAVPSNCIVAGAGMQSSIVVAATVNGRWLGVDSSNVELRDFQFQGVANSGATNTAQAIWFHAQTADLVNISVRRVWVRQVMPNDAAIRIDGNGDLVTPATFFVRRARVEDCLVTEYYDQAPANIGVQCNGIYLFGGIKGAWVQRNYVDGNNGKNCINAQSEANDIHIEDNICVNAGAANVGVGGVGSYAITAYSSYTTVNVVDVFICRNTIINSAKAGIYLAAAGKYVIADNILDTCDTNPNGLGAIGSGAIMLNNSTDTASNGMGTVVGNTIIDPGLIGIYINTASFGRAKCTVTGNSLRVTTAVARTAIVLWGRGVVISSNEIRGFQTGLFLYNTAANIVGDAVVEGNEFDGTGATGSPVGIVVSSAANALGPMVIIGNKFIGCLTGMDVRPVADVIVQGNHFSGCTLTCARVDGVVRGTLSGNIADNAAGAPATGLFVALLAATATARVTIHGNLFSVCNNPLTLTENTGLAIVSGNDFGALPGVSADKGDASVVLNSPFEEVVTYGTTLTALRTVQFKNAKAYRGQKHRVHRSAPAPGAFGLNILDDAGATLYAGPVSQKGFMDLIFDGTNWRFAGYATYP